MPFLVPTITFIWLIKKNIINAFFIGKDKTVVLWSIQDHITASATDQTTNKSPGSGGSIIKKTGEGNEDGNGPSVGPRGIYCGHEDTVEDVAFCPST